MKKSLQEVRKESLQWYCEYLDKLQSEISDEYELMSFCMFAGRLASLGKCEYVAKADALLSNQSFSNSVDGLFTERIRQINLELEDLSDKELGVTISELQDLYCFFKYTSFPFSGALHDYLDDTVNKSSFSDISIKTIKFLRRYRKIFPIQTEDAISAVLRPHPPILLEIEAAAIPFKRTEFKPTFQKNEWTVVTDRYKLHLKVTDNSADKKTFEAYLTYKDKNYLASDIVFSQGRVFAIQNRENPLRWTLDYTLFPSLDCKKQNDLPLKITMPLGRQAEIPNPFPVISAAWHEFAVQLVNSLHDSYRIAAADVEDVKKNYNVEGTNSRLFVIVLLSESEKLVKISVCGRDADSDYSSELDGWTICDLKGNWLAVIEDGFAVFKIDSNPDLKIMIIDANGVIHRLSEIND